MILVPGVIRGQGASLVAANLAAALSRNQPDVTLVCADLEGSVISEMAGLPSGPGLTDVLADGIWAGDAEQRLAAAPRLRVIPPGSSAGPDAEDIRQDALERLLDELGAGSRWVVLEGPAVDARPDISTLAHVADAAVLVAEIPRTRSDQLIDGVQHLGKMGADVLGVALLPARGGPARRGHAGSAGRRGRPRRQRRAARIRGDLPAERADEPVKRGPDKTVAVDLARPEPRRRRAPFPGADHGRPGGCARRAVAACSVRPDRGAGRVLGQATGPRRRRPGLAGRPAINRTTAAAPTRSTGTVAPLTGLAVTAAVAQRPAVAVLVSGPDPSGLGSADLVFEEMSSPVRYLAVFQSAEANVGPVPATRPMDGQALSVLHPLTGYDGGTASFISVLDATKIVDVGYPGHASLYASGAGRPDRLHRGRWPRRDGPTGRLRRCSPTARRVSRSRPSGSRTRPRSGWTCRASRNCSGITTSRRAGGRRRRAVRGSAWPTW